jgi:hypothetical protein
MSRIRIISSQQCDSIHMVLDAYLEMLDPGTVTALAVETLGYDLLVDTPADLSADHPHVLNDEDSALVATAVLHTLGIGPAGTQAGD